MKCPNKKSQWWKDLVSEIGETGAWHVHANMSEDGSNINYLKENYKVSSATIPSTLRRMVKETDINPVADSRGRFKIIPQSLEESKDHQIMSTRLKKKYKKSFGDNIVEIVGDKFVEFKTSIEHLKKLRIDFNEQDFEKSQALRDIITNTYKFELEVFEEASDIAKTIRNKEHIPDIQFAIDMVNGLVAVSADTKDNITKHADVLAAIAVASLIDSPEIQRMLGMDGDNPIHNGYKQTDEYKTGIKIYTDIYGASNLSTKEKYRKINMAILTDILSGYILNEARKGTKAFASPGMEKIKNILQRIWAKFKKLLPGYLSDADKRRGAVEDKIKNILTDVARETVRGNLVLGDNQKETYYQTSYSPVVHEIVQQSESILKQLKGHRNDMYKQTTELLSDIERAHYYDYLAKFGNDFTGIMIRLNELKSIMSAGIALTTSEHSELNEIIEILALDKKYVDEFQLDKDLQLALGKSTKKLEDIQGNIDRHEFDIAIITTTDHISYVAAEQWDKILSLKRIDGHLDNVEMGKLQQWLDTYAPILDQLQIFFDSMTEDMFDAYPALDGDIVRLKESAEKAVTDINRIIRYVKKESARVRTNLVMEQTQDNFADPGVSEFGTFDEVLAEMEVAQDDLPAAWWLVSIDNTSNLTNSAMLKKLLGIRRQGEARVKEDNQGIVAGFENFIEEARDDRVIRQYMLDKNLGRAWSLVLFEFEKSGEGTSKRTHNLISPWKLKEHDEAKSEESNNIISEMEKEFKRLFDMDKKIPRGEGPVEYAERVRFFTGNWIEESAESEESKAIMREQVGHIKGRYDQAWQVWYAKNTENIKDSERVIADKKRTLSPAKYAIWEEKNIVTKEYVDPKTGRKDTYTYYKGELVTPSVGKTIKTRFGKIKTKDWSNSDFTALKESPVFMKFHTQYKDMLDRYRKKLPSRQWSKLSDLYRMPQTTRDWVEVLHRSSVRRNLKYIKSTIGASILSIFKARQDDYDNVKTGIELAEQGMTLNSVGPPVRYEQLLPDPEMQSEDIVSSLTVFMEMAEHYNLTAGMEGEIKAVRKAQENALPADQKDANANILEQFDNIVEMFVKEEGNKGVWIMKKYKGPRLDILFRSMKSAVMVINLGINTIAATAAMFENQTHFSKQARIGRLTTHESRVRSRKEFLASIATGAALRPESELHQLRNYFNVQRTNQDIYKNASKSRLSDIFQRAMSGFGLWHLAEVPGSTMVMLSVLDNIRLTEDNQWVTREKFLSQAKGNRKETTRLKQAWKDLGNNWAVDQNGDMLSKEDFIAKHGEKVWGSARKGKTARAAFTSGSVKVGNSTKYAAKVSSWAKSTMNEKVSADIHLRMSILMKKVTLQASSTTKTPADRNPFYSLVSTFRSFFVIRLNNFFQQEHKSAVTGEIEMGQRASLIAFATKDLWGRIHDIARVVTTMSTKDWNENRSVIPKERMSGLIMGAIQIKNMLIYTSMWHLAQVILSSIDFDDEDEWKIAYVRQQLFRIYMESVAFGGTGEFLGVLTDPIAGISGFLTDIVTTLYNLAQADKHLEEITYRQRLTPTLKKYTGINLGDYGREEVLEKTDYIQNGIYAHRTKLFKSIMDVSPGQKAYFMGIHPFNNEFGDPTGMDDAGVYLFNEFTKETISVGSILHQRWFYNQVGKQLGMSEEDVETALKNYK